MGLHNIIAVDLGKFNSVVCVMDACTRRSAFVTVATTPQTLHDLFVAHAAPEPAQTLVVVEACDAAGWLHDLATSLGLGVAVANANADAWKWKKVKRKTDRDDALKLATMAARDELPTVHMPDPRRRQRRRLIQHRRTLVARRTACKNAIRSIFNQQGLSHELPRGTKAWTRAGLEQLAAHAKPLDECDDVPDLWRGRLHLELEQMRMLHQQILAAERKLDELAKDDPQVKLAETVDGVGTRLAEAVVVCLDDPHRFKTAAEVSSYVGLVPKQMQSGETNRLGRITRRGPSLLRGLLVEVAWMVYRHNDWAKSFVARVSRGMRGRKKIAIVALARKLLVILWAMLRDNKPWRAMAPPPDVPDVPCLT